MTDNAVLDIGYLDTLPPEWKTDLLSDIRKKIGKSNAKVVILDYDPTGTQTVRDLPVLTHWSEQALCEELAGRYPAFFILTNSRSLPESGACKLAHEIGTLLRRASARHDRYDFPFPRVRKQTGNSILTQRAIMSNNRLPDFSPILKQPRQCFFVTLTGS
jgi:hypothetical protein